jgi:hypothetical protein
MGPRLSNKSIFPRVLPRGELPTAGGESLTVTERLRLLLQGMSYSSRAGIGTALRPCQPQAQVGQSPAEGAANGRFLQIDFAPVVIARHMAWPVGGTAPLLGESHP